ncbi:uncharacterized protein LOC119661510 isoform X1 [Hermetia illucens]|uniref:uncharacterized protein LOC119661510 isoform X1 n=1 Tax=Hermetia illucens TaxID=343691 RepID=UPI0018CC1CD7|nr:uncharacterized protein LOC119661510 isoform X1 [Hermetia illucens]
MRTWYFLSIVLLVVLQLAAQTKESPRQGDQQSGKECSLGQFPFVVAVLDGYYNIWCTAALITASRGLTVAHRFTGWTKRVFFCMGGDTKVVKGSDLRFRQIKVIVGCRMHPKAEMRFGSSIGYNVEYDQAVITLDSPFVLSSYLSTIRISTTHLSEGRDCYLVAFNYSSSYSESEQGLRYGKFISNKKETCPIYSKNYPSIYCTQGEMVSTNEGNKGGLLITPRKPYELYGTFARRNVFSNAVRNARWIYAAVNRGCKASFVMRSLIDLCARSTLTYESFFSDSFM